VETAWTVVGTLASVLVGVGVSVLSLSPPDFRIAKICFWLAACMPIGMAIYWTSTTKDQFLPRVAAVDGAIGVAAILLLPAGLLWIRRRERPRRNPFRSILEQVNKDLDQFNEDERARRIKPAAETSATALPHGSTDNVTALAPECEWVCFDVRTQLVRRWRRYPFYPQDSTNDIRMWTAVVLPFRNDVSPDVQHVRDVKRLIATINFGDGRPPIIGYWLDSTGPHVDLNKNGRRDLVLAVYDAKDRALFLNDKRDTSGEVAADWIWFPQATESVEYERVRVTLSSGGHYVGHNEYRLRIDANHIRCELLNDAQTTKATLAESMTVGAALCSLVVPHDAGYAEWDTENASPESFDNARQALVATFQNDSREVIGRLSATISYAEVASSPVDSAIVAAVSDGAWLDEDSSLISIRPSKTQRLIVALYDDKAFISVNDNRRDVAKQRGCTEKPLPQMRYIAVVRLVRLDADSHIVDEMTERFGIEIRQAGPKITTLGPPGSLA
jgi:hypothetical protein